MQTKQMAVPWEMRALVGLRQYLHEKQRFSERSKKKGRMNLDTTTARNNDGTLLTRTIAPPFPPPFLEKVAGLGRQHLHANRSGK